jgi:hypothetical protein
MLESHALWLLLASVPALASDALPSASTDKIGDTPDLMQSLPAAALPDRGIAHCGPVAVSNSLAWLARQWIRNGLSGSAAVWLKIGWYRQVAGEWRKFAGHWVTLVGYGVDERGRPAPDVFIVHDPAPRSGERLSNDHVKLLPLESGTLRSLSGRRTISSTGFFRLGGGLKIKDGADLGVLDAAVVLQMK